MCQGPRLTRGVGKKQETEAEGNDRKGVRKGVDNKRQPYFDMPKMKPKSSCQMDRPAVQVSIEGVSPNDDTRREARVG